MLRPVGVAPNPNAALRPVAQRPQNEEKEAHRPGMAVQPTIVNVPRRAGSEEEKQGMARGGKVKRPKKKAIKKGKVAGGIAQRVKQVQTVKVNINTGRVKREKDAKGKKPAAQPAAQSAFNMFGYRLAPSMPIMGGSAAPQQDTSKLDLVLGRIKQQQDAVEHQKKIMEEINATRQPTGQAAASSIFDTPTPESNFEDLRFEESSLFPGEKKKPEFEQNLGSESAAASAAASAAPSAAASAAASAAPQSTSTRFNIPIRRKIPGSEGQFFTERSIGYINPAIQRAMPLPAPSEQALTPQPPKKPYSAARASPRQKRISKPKQ
jgi:hypothetical protein